METPALLTNMYFRGRKQALFLFVAAMMGAMAGCAAVSVKQGKRLDNPHGRYVAEGARIMADPVAYLRQLKARCDQFGAYRLTFYRQERLGIIPKLRPMEKIHAAFRRAPFSVKFEWNNSKMPYYESVYVKGQNHDKLLVRERKGIFPFPPQVRILNVQDPTTFGFAKNPITAFGLAQVTSRTLAPFDDPRLRGIMTVAYDGVVELEPTQRPAHHLRIELPPMKGYRYTRQDFYIDAETLLPAGTDLWLKNGQLDARYRYADVDTNVQLTDKDFRLAKDHPKMN